MESLKNYIYMDMVGIDSLLSQITSELVETSHIQTTSRKAGNANGSIGFSEVVKKIFKKEKRGNRDRRKNGDGKQRRSY